MKKIVYFLCRSISNNAWGRWKTNNAYNLHIENIFKINENKNIILVTHGNLIGIVLKYFFNLEFNFDSWKQISMPDMYILDFDKNKNAIGFKRDVENIDNLFYVK